MIHTEFTSPSFYPAPLTTLGGRGLTGADSSSAPVTHEQLRREGLRRMHNRMIVSSDVGYDPLKYADLRDGGLMPRESVDRTAVLLWLLMLAGGCVFWIWALPKIIRAFVAAIVIGANTFH